jgi:flagellar biosynthesis anti-sigma factor FlgM
MKISNDFPTPELNPDKARVEETARAERGERGHRKTSGGSEDPVSLSPRAQLLSRLSEAAEHVPEARHARVEAIQQAVAESRYFVSAHNVAESMLAALYGTPGGI